MPVSTVTLPVAGDVRSGTTYGASLGTTGTLIVGAGGSYSDPGIANVKIGTAYIYNSVSLTGTYDGSDRWTDPGVINVRAGTAYKANSTSNNKTGTVVLPPVGKVELAYAYGAGGSEYTGTLIVSGQQAIRVHAPQDRVVAAQVGTAKSAVGVKAHSGTYVTFTVTQSGTYQILVSGTEGESDPFAATLMLYKGGQLLSVSRRSGPGGNPQIVSALTAGDHTVAVIQDGRGMTRYNFVARLA